MSIETKVIIHESILKGLNISRDRYKYIISYIMQMIKDYKGHPIDIIKEIALNLKEKERYFAMFTLGSSLSPLFNEMDDIEKEHFVTDIINALKFNEEKVAIITEYMSDTVEKQMRENATNTEVIKGIINSKFTDIEKDYIIFILGMVLT